MRLSDMGGDTVFNADGAAVAYNSQADEYLVVWGGDDDSGGLVEGEFEIFGQRIDGATGAEIGDDFRISHQGPDGDPDYDAFLPAVAYNSQNDQYLVVWHGDDDSGGLVEGEFEIFGQRIDGATGAEIGDDFRISDMGPDGDTDYAANDPAVAYNSQDDQYLVVWHGDDDSGDLVDEEFEIFGQRIDGATGAEIGDDFQISDMGSDGDLDYPAHDPAVAYNRQANEYLVVWYGDKMSGTAFIEYEIYSQRIDGASGAEIGGDFRISDMGPDGDTDYAAFNPAVAYDSQADEYLVVWHGGDDSNGLVEGEHEIFGQRIDGATGAEIGGDFRISHQGPNEDPDYDARDPAVTYDSQTDEYLVVWHGDDDSGGLVEGEFEIFGQRIDGATGAEIGGDFRISEMGPDGDWNYEADLPSVACDSQAGHYLVVWSGEDDGGGLVEGEYEIFGQRIDGATGVEIDKDFRISEMGGDLAFDAYRPSVAYDSQADEYLVVWRGDDNSGDLVDEEEEIFGQRIDGATGAEIDKDFRISEMGPDGDPFYGAHTPAVAYNSQDDQYLVVWNGDIDSGGLVEDEYEIFGQRIDGATGAEIGDDFRVSEMGPDGDPDYDAGDPAMAYNSQADEYLVVWYGDDDSGGLVDNELEIFGQRIDGATGAEIGDDFRISHQGPDGDPDYVASGASVAYNSQADEYLVVWSGDDDSGGLVNDEFEIFGQRIDGATGAEIGGDFRISDMGSDGDPDYDALAPAVAYDSQADEYLVVWYGDDDSGGLVDQEFEIFGQRIDATNGSEIGGDVRLSDMGPDGDPDYGGGDLAVAYDSQAHEYLVVWDGDDDRGGLVDQEFEIFGQRYTVAPDRSMVYLPLVVR